MGAFGLVQAALLSYCLAVPRAAAAALADVFARRVRRCPTSYLIQLSAKINSPASRSLRGRARVTTLHDIQRGSKKGSCCTVIDVFI